MKNGFTVKSASEYIGVSQNTIYNMIDDGRLTAVMSDGNYIIDGEDVRIAKNTKDITDENKNILKSSESTLKKAKSELKFKAGRVFSSISSEIETFNDFMENEYTKQMIESKTLFSEALKNNSPDLLDINNEIIKLYDKPYEMQGEIILKLKSLIDDYYEKYMFINQLEEFYKYVKSNSMPFNDELELAKIMLSEGGLAEGLKTGKIFVNTKKKRW